MIFIILNGSAQVHIVGRKAVSEAKERGISPALRLAADDNVVSLPQAWRQTGGCMTDEGRQAAPARGGAAPAQQNRWRAIGIVGASLALLVVLAIGWGFLRPDYSPPLPPGPATEETGIFRPTPAQLSGFTIEPVRLVSFRSERIAEGNIVIDDDLTTSVFSPYSGRVARLFARLGDRVLPGAPLFAVEASEFVQAVNDLITAAATLRTARGQLTQATTNEKRAHELYLAKGGALKEWQQSQTDLATAQNAVRAAEIALAAVRNRLRILDKSDSEIAALEAQPTQKLDPLAVVTAPIAGTVTQRRIGLGQYIQSGGDNPVYTIGDLSTLWLVANVREVDAPLMRVGAPVAVRVPAYPERVFDATISWVAPALDPTTHRLPVRAEIANPDGALKPVMFANFSIGTGAAVTAPAVPPGAIVYEGDSARVWVVRDDGTIAARVVTVGRTEGGMVEISEGLSPGDRVVTRGTLFIDRAGGAG
jgi:cobalt-zinc-cadmium efflux system membrane fusion protein